MDEKLLNTLQKIRILSEQNQEFAQAMRKMFGSESSTSTVTISNNISGDVIAIREALEIRANKSISYDFVKEQRLRDQLIIDNLRMENAALNLQQGESERFYTFCVNAFYQLENIINYYFHITFPKNEDFVQIIEEYTAQEPNEYYRYKKTGREKNVGDIQIVYKINALCNILFPGESVKWILGTLRQVRNEGEHRCMIIQQEKDNSNNLYKFFQSNTFNSVRIALKKVINAIKMHIGKPIVYPVITVEATIKTMLPSACYLEIGTNRELLPSKFFTKIKNVKENDVIKVNIAKGKIIDIIL